MKKSSREEALKIARFIGCSGAHKDDKGNWLPCSSAEKLMEISTEAESSKYKPSAKADEKKKNRGARRRYIKPGYEPLGERGISGIETLPGGGLVSGKDAEFEEYELVELKADSYTKPNLRESIKRRIMAGSRGGKPGEWSARKAQLLAMEYRRAGGGYRGGKKKPQRSLDKWTREEWTTSDGEPAIRKGGTNRYLPKKAWQKLTPAEREATNRKKRRASRQGRQFVANTERARRAGAEERNSQKSMIITRARPRKGDPDVYEDPDSARLRARALGCIGIARRETPDGDYVWTPCTNISDFRRRTGQSVLGQRDEIRRFRRRLRQVGGPAYGRAAKSLYPPELNFSLDGRREPWTVSVVQRKQGPRLPALSTRRKAIKSIEPLTHIHPHGFEVKKQSSSELNESIIAALATKVGTHNDQMRSADKPTWSMASLEKLKTVYTRGLAAYQQFGPKSITSNQWAMDRVNAFLLILKSGQPINKKYVTDNDLLHDDNPWKKRGIRKKSIFYDSGPYPISSGISEKSKLRSISNFASPIGRRGRGLEGRGFRRSNYRRFARFDIRAQDADGDGKVQDGTNQERPVVAAAEPEIRKLFNRLKDPDGGFTFSLNDFDDVKSGWAIARKGNGIKLKVSDVFDDDGEIKEDALIRLEALLDMRADEILKSKPNATKKVTLGGWHNPEDGNIYFDITDVYDKGSLTKEEAMAEALHQNQISIVDLGNLHAAIEDGNWDLEGREIFINTGGNGNNLIDSPGKENAQNRKLYNQALNAAKERAQILKQGFDAAQKIIDTPKVEAAERRKKKLAYLKRINDLSVKPDLTADEMIELMRLLVSRESDKSAMNARDAAEQRGLLNQSTKINEEFILPSQVKRLYALEGSGKRVREDFEEEYFPEDEPLFHAKVGDIVSGDELVGVETTGSDAIVEGLFLDNGDSELNEAISRIVEGPDTDYYFIEINVPDSVRKENPVTLFSASGSSDDAIYFVPNGSQFQVKTINTSTVFYKGDIFEFKRIVVDWIGVQQNK